MNNHGLSSGEMHADELTWREQEVLILLAEHLTNREIAEHLHLAESTVKDYVGRILSKLYVKNRRQAVERAKELGLLEPVPRTRAEPRTNLPAETTPFVGRADELEDIDHQLSGTRLLTLTGPGGIGKTRLAVKAAGKVVADFKDGCFFVPLAPISSVDHIVQTIAEALRFPIATHEDPQHQLLRYLQKRELLLVIDNFEHLLEGAGIVGEILQAAPAVKVLATSRERLNLQSETNLIVRGMSTYRQVKPEDIKKAFGAIKDPLSSDAITLFIQSANRVRPGFDPSPEELEQIVEICQIVEGMPLAIELAAAWLHILKADEIVEELKKGLDILTTDVRDTPRRHRSIRAVFDHSWSLLDRTEQEILMHLSVFRGGFTREAAQQVAGASLQHLAGLVNKSFLSHDPDSGRLEIHELLRQYAHERLGETPEISRSAQESHGAYFARFMQQQWQHLKGHRQQRALTETEADIQNVRAAWRYHLDQRNAPQIWKFIFGLWYVYWIRWWNHAGMELFAEAVRALQGEEDEESIAARALAMALQGYFMAWLDIGEQSYELTKEGVKILEELNYPEALALAYDSLGLNAFMVTRFSEEVKAANKMLEIASKQDDKWLLALALFSVSMGNLIIENFPEARRQAESSLDLNQEIGDMVGSATSLIVLGHAAFGYEDYEDARGFYLRCLNLSEQVGFYFAIQTVTKYLCKVALSMGKIAEAEKYLHKSLLISKEIGYLRDVVNLIYEFSRLQVAHGNLERAAELLAFVIQHPASQAIRMLEGRIRDSAVDLLGEVEEDLPPETYSAAIQRGQALELGTVVTDLVG
jgi:predicted ATPase/DNA-binding CsgD family transcriptional regulator